MQYPSSENADTCWKEEFFVSLSNPNPLLLHPPNGKGERKKKNFHFWDDCNPQKYLKNTFQDCTESGMERPEKKVCWRI